MNKERYAKQVRSVDELAVLLDNMDLLVLVTEIRYKMYKVFCMLCSRT